MLRRSTLLLALFAVACASATLPEPTLSPAAPTTDAPFDTRTTTWADVRREIEALICMRTFDVPGHGAIEEPVFGRESCELPPPSQPLPRAVAAAYVSARPCSTRSDMRGRAPCAPRSPATPVMRGCPRSVAHT